MDLRHLEKYFTRSHDAAVGLVIESDDEEQPFFLGSGVLVLLGGRELVLTAAHNVWSKVRSRRNEIAIGRPPTPIITLIHPGDGSAGAVYCPAPLAGEFPEPDVAVIEITEKAILLAKGQRRPFAEDEIRYFDGDAVNKYSADEVLGRELVVTGLPVAFAQYGPGLTLKRNVGTAGDLSTPMVSMRVSAIPRHYRRHPFQAEPAEGRGMHVMLSRRMEDNDDAVTRLRCPDGLSGGPVVAPEGAGLLVSLMRGAIDHNDHWDEWCEPAAEAVRLLLEHESADVRAAARRVTERYDDDRARSLAVHRTLGARPLILE